MTDGMEGAREIQNRFAKVIVAKLLGSLEANPIHISEIETVLIQYTAALDAEKPAEDARECAGWVHSAIGFGALIDPVAEHIQSYAETYAAKKCAAERLRTLEEVKEVLRLGNSASIAIVIDREIANAKKTVEEP